MLEDFLLKSARSTRTGVPILSREGYGLILNANGHAIIGYHAIHRERTWAQVKAGAPSRFSRKRARRPSGGDPGQPGPDLALDDMLSSVDAQKMFLTSRALTSYSRIESLAHLDDDTLDAIIRDEITTWPASGAVTQREDGLVVVTSPRRTWLVTPDGRSVIGVKLALMGPPELWVSTAL